MADKVDLFKSSRLKQQSAFVLQHRAGAAVFVLFILDVMLNDEFAQPSKTPAENMLMYVIGLAGLCAVGYGKSNYGCFSTHNFELKR